MDVPQHHQNVLVTLVHQTNIDQTEGQITARQIIEGRTTAAETIREIVTEIKPKKIQIACLPMLKTDGIVLISICIHQLLTIMKNPKPPT